MTPSMTDALDLHIAGLSAGYRRRMVIRDLTLAPPLSGGRITALVGPNAAGKSTLLRALAGLVPAHGSVRLGDLELTRLRPAERARHVAFMPQSLPRGVAFTVLDCVIAALRAAPGAGDLLPAAAQKRAVTVLERLGILDLAMETLDTLSGGQRQMAGLAQAVVRNPRLLLLDEPTSALDLRHQDEVMRTARTLADEGRIVVIVLHDLAVAARWADRIVVLADGRVHADGTPHDAITPAVLAAVYGVKAHVETSPRGHLHIEVAGPLPCPGQESHRHV